MKSWISTKKLTVLAPVQVEVKFDIDANGILSVSATDKGTQKKQDIKITGASTLNKDEIDRMVSDAERFAGEDKELREAVDTKNQVRQKPLRLGFVSGYDLGSMMVEIGVM